MDSRDRLNLTLPNLTSPKDCHPIVNSQGKLQGAGPPKRVRIVWTTGWVEPGDNGMMVIILGLWSQLLNLGWVPGQMSPGLVLCGFTWTCVLPGLVLPVPKKSSLTPTGLVLPETL